MSSPSLGILVTGTFEGFRGATEDVREFVRRGGVGKSSEGVWLSSQQKELRGSSATSGTVAGSCAAL